MIVDDNPAMGKVEKRIEEPIQLYESNDPRRS